MLEDYQHSAAKNKTLLFGKKKNDHTSTDDEAKHHTESTEDSDNRRTDHT
jgi:hypothetical protein